jgi:hypothetical protein
MDKEVLHRRTTLRTRCVEAALLGLLAVCPAPSQPSAQPDTSTPEEALWQQVITLHRALEATPWHGPTSAPAQRHAVDLCDRLRLYQTLYPGGQHRDDAIGLELNTLFALGTARGGSLTALRSRVAELLRNPPSRAAEEEAAYWDLLCRRFASDADRHARATTTAPVSPPDALSDAACREYLSRYPRSRHAPRLATLLFESAARRGDRETMRTMVQHLGTHFPQHAVTATVLGTWNRLESIGRPFWLSCHTPDGRVVDTREYVGHPVLIVVWAGFDERACERVREVERFRTRQPAIRVVGVNLDASEEEMQDATRELGITWPQCHDRRGWGNEFVRSWGVREIPFVFVLDGAGQLVGATGGTDWADLVAKTNE